MATLPSDFLEALRRLAGVFDAYDARTASKPVLVGGAAVSIYTGGMIASGDFDVIAAADDVFDRAMRDHGFQREDREGHLMIGWYHPEVPTIGVQLVSGRLFEGRTDPQRIALLPVEDGGTIALAPIEDLIADRCSANTPDPGNATPRCLSRRASCVSLRGLDKEYLVRRVLEDGDPDLLELT